MNWAESPDLLEIFLNEIDERSERLINGAGDLFRTVLDPELLEDLVRDAHTLKGSANMIGKSDLGAAAAGLERVWKLITSKDLQPTNEIARALESTAKLLPDAARDVRHRSDLADATDELSRIAESIDEDLVAALPSRQSATSRPSPRPGQVTRPVEAPLPIPSATQEIDEPQQIERHTRPGSPDLSESELGGLLRGLKDELSSTVTRVDTGDLYQLINRAVEIGLETEALADLTHVAIEGADPRKLMVAWRGQLSRLSTEVAQLQDWAVSLANIPVGEAASTFPQLSRFLSRKLDKDVTFEMSGFDIMIDRQIVDLIREPLRHLVVNAIDHGIESAAERLAAGKPATGTVTLAAEIRDERLIIEVTDDGRGVAWEEVEALARQRGLSTGKSEVESHLFRPGFTTVSKVTEFSGTGEGLALVADAADKVGGSVEIRSARGRGTSVTLDLPRSLILQDVVIVAVGHTFFALPAASVLGSVTISSSRQTIIDGAPTVPFRNESVPVISLAKVVGLRPEFDTDQDALIVSTRSGLIAVTVDEIIDQRRVAVKSLGPILEGADHLAGAAFLGGGDVLVVVDHNHLGEQARRPLDHQGTKHRVLVVDDSAGVRQLIAATLRSKGFEVVVSSSAREGVVEMANRRFDALVVDYSMPQSNGVQLVRALRSSGVTMPIVMVSGVADESDKAAAWAAGVD
ncbi:MAG: response regulator, partial [Acidimicrobiia bacterium]|nr:response regulator [Acidimicrobiia bacterium]